MTDRYDIWLLKVGLWETLSIWSSGKHMNIIHYYEFFDDTGIITNVIIYDRTVRPYWLIMDD